MNNKIDFSKIKVISFYTLLLFIVWGLSNTMNNMDYDIWARLIQGKHVVETGSVMYKDILSYTPTHTWYDPEWLSSAFLYLIINTFGIASTIIIKCLLIFFSIVMITIGAHEICKYKYSSLHLEYFIFALLFLFWGGSAGLFLRCQLFSYVILPIWIILLEKMDSNYDSPKVKKYMFILPVVMLLWLNLHGACIAGVGIMVLYIIGRLLNKKPTKKYLLAFIPVLLVFFINPWGYKYILFLLHSTTLDRSWIVEWQSLIGHQNLVFVKEILIMMIFSMLIYILKIIFTKFKDINYSKLLLLLVTYYLAWAHYKHIPLYAIVAGIYLYEDYIYLTKKIFNFFYLKLKIDEICQKYIMYLKDIVVYAAVFGSAVYINITNPISHTLSNTALLSTYPVGAIEFLRINNIKGNMFLPYFYGSYAAYKTYPNIKIFMDGRQEQVYDYGLFDSEMFFMYGMHKSTRPIVEKYVPDIYLVEYGWDYANYVSKLKDYKLIYRDKAHAIYIKNELAKESYIYLDKNYRLNIDEILDTKINFKK